MMRLLSPLLLSAALAFGFACRADAQKATGPVPVKIEMENGRARLYRGGRPYYIKGAGGSGNLRTLAEAGGNSVRTWSTRNAGALLDSAQALGLTVTLGLPATAERHGFNYDDPEAVAAQQERIRKEVLAYKDHPALLAWAIGNELNLNASNPRVWDAVDAVSRMIHEIDPNHLTTTTLAGVNADLIREIDARAPDLDLISIQMYGDIVNLPRRVREIPITRPYMVTEWGATGHWEVQKTPWGAPIEDNSSVKADNYRSRYAAAIAPDSMLGLGSYVFLWGQKQERTPTWYGVFLASGEKTESVDAMQRLWTGSWPDNRAPRLERALLDGRTAYDGIRLAPGETYAAEVIATDPDGDPLTYVWDVKPESTDLGEGGDFESTPRSIAGRFTPEGAPTSTFTAPAEEGAYRLFIYVYDNAAHAAHANIPFYVGQ